jgi:hypothetical protein
MIQSPTQLEVTVKMTEDTDTHKTNTKEIL